MSGLAVLATMKARARTRLKRRIKRSIRGKLRPRSRKEENSMIIQARIIEGIIDFERLKEDLEEKLENHNELLISPMIFLKNGSESFEYYQEILNELKSSAGVSDFSIETVMEIEGQMNIVEYDIDFLSTGPYDESRKNSEYNIYFETGNTVRYRWLYNMKDAYIYISTLEDKDSMAEGKRYYLASEILYEGIIIPGGSFLVDNGQIVEDYGFYGQNPQTFEELLKLMIKFYKDVKKKDKVIYAATDGGKSRYLLKFLEEQFSEIEILSFWEDDGCKLAKEIDAQCQILVPKDRTAFAIESYTYIKALQEDAIAVWAADSPFLKRHKIHIPRIFSPLWFIEKPDYEKLGIKTTSLDEVLREVV